MGNAASSEYAAPCEWTQELVGPNGTTTTQTFQGVNNGDTALMMFGTTLVMLQTPAMGIAQAGMIRRKNSLSMMMQCMSGMAIGSLLWWVIGHGLAFGPDVNGDGFIGNPWPYLFFKDLPRGGESPPLCYPAATSIPATVHAAFQMMFALMVPVIVTGAWAEKMTMKSFFVFMVLWPILCYYPQTHWLWGPGGWLAKEGALDFAGGMNIHTSAGCAGLVVSKMLAPRRNLEKLRMTHHNIPLLVIGGTIVWAGWYSFNGCSALAGTASAAAALLNTHLSASTSGLTWVLLTYRQDRCFHVTDMMNGAFAGLAGITPGSGWVPDWAAVVTGFLVGCASWWTCGYFKDRLKIDDTLDCFSLQATPGMLGSILVGLWAKGAEYGLDDNDKSGLGIFYGGTGKLLGAQIAGVLSCAVWTSIMTYIVMLVIKHTVGYDITVQMEDEGLDKTQIGEIGYDIVGTSDSYMASEEDKTQELIEACARGNLGLVRKMVAAGASAGRGDYDARTPLHLAAANGQQHIVQYLVESCKQSVKVDAQDNFGGTPLQDAMEGGHADTVKYLKEHGGTIDETKYVGMLNEAAFAGDAKAVHSMITKAGVSPSGGDYDDRTALHIAVCEGHTAVVHVLMAAGADAQARDRWQQTPLDNAEQFGRHNLVPVLNKAVKVEIDAEALPGRGDRAEFDKEATVGIMTTATKEMCAAASGGNKEQVKTLLKRGGAANVADYDGRTPLHLAAAAGHLGVAKLLAKQKDVSINCVDRFASTPLQEAAKNGHHKLAEWLRQNGASTVNQKYGYALCCAARDGDTDKLQSFVDAGVDLGTADYDGRTALHLAACNGDAKTCQFVLDNLDSDDNVNTLDRMRRTPLDDATGGAKAVIAGKGGQSGTHFTDSISGAVEEQANAAGTV